MADLIAVQCQRCGSESPFSLATPDRLSCDYCGFVGPLPEAARQSLHYAAQVLPQLDAGQRSLSAKHRRALRIDRGAKVLRNIVIGVVLVALALWNLFFAIGMLVMGDLVFAPIPLITTGIVLGAIALAIRAGEKARTELASLYAAAAPVRPGAPTRCRICGAVLPLERETGIVSCVFCRSDNLVAPEILATTTWHRTKSLDEYKTQLETRTKQASNAAAAGTAIVVAAAVGAPVLSLVVTVIGIVLYIAVDVAIDGEPASAEEVTPREPDR